MKGEVGVITNSTPLGPLYKYTVITPQIPILILGACCLASAKPRCAQTPSACSNAAQYDPFVGKPLRQSRLDLVNYMY